MKKECVLDNLLISFVLSPQIPLLKGGKAVRYIAFSFFNTRATNSKMKEP